MSEQTPPEVIYLQWDGPDNQDVTWCDDRVSDDDVEYIRKSLYDDEINRVLELRAQLAGMRRNYYTVNAIRANMAETIVQLQEQLDQAMSKPNEETR